MLFSKKQKWSKKIDLLNQLLPKKEDKIATFYFTKKLYKKLKKQVKEEKNVRFMNFSEFIDKITIILINNQNKVWFTIRKGLLLLDTKTYPIYRKLTFIKDDKFLKLYLKGIYKKYFYIF